MNRGYYKTWRKALDSGWLKNHKLWAFWSYCLMRASYKEHDAIVGYQTVHLMPGQFIFGRKKAAADLDLTEREVRTVLDFLIKSQNVTIKTTNKFSIITIVNWDTYQSQETENDQQNDQQMSNKCPTNVQQMSTYNKGNKGKNGKKESNADFILPSWINSENWNGFEEMRKTKKNPMTDRAKKIIIGKLEKLKSDGYDPNAVLDQSTERGWQGVFEIKDNGKSSDDNGKYDFWDAAK